METKKNGDRDRDQYDLHATDADRELGSAGSAFVPVLDAPPHVNNRGTSKTGSALGSALPDLQQYMGRVIDDSALVEAERTAQKYGRTIRRERFGNGWMVQDVTL